ncbi:MAG: hypothetical protein H7230_03425 [Candidatus Parcubacteria bacterium]|nr:hypothetical protein [Candidatus Paceibacterota bacterium]
MTTVNNKNPKLSPGTIIRRDGDVRVIDFFTKNASKFRKKPNDSKEIAQPRTAVVRNPLPYARMHRFGKWRKYQVIDF